MTVSYCFVVGFCFVFYYVLLLKKICCVAESKCIFFIADCVAFGRMIFIVKRVFAGCLIVFLGEKLT